MDNNRTETKEKTSQPKNYVYIGTRYQVTLCPQHQVVNTRVGELISPNTD